MSVLAQLIASGLADTKPALAASTGLARSSIDASLGRLRSLGLVLADMPTAPSGRGRPPQVLRINPESGTILVFDLTPHHVRVAAARMDQRVLGMQRAEFALDAGPEATLDFAVGQAEQTLTELGLTRRDVVATVVSLPGPVDTRRGVPVRPPIMPGWDEFGVADYMMAAFRCPCVVDNDVNIIAIGEARVLPADQCPMLVVKVGTGIGGGLVSASGTLHRGADGAACDIGHLRVPGAQEVICSCGNVGCIEALASVEAITRRYAEMIGRPDLRREDLLDAARTGDPMAIRLIRDAAALLGETVASLIHVYNPARIVLAGPLTSVTDDLLAGVRSVAYRRALPLATRNLTLAHSVIGDLAGVVGAVVLGIEKVLSPEALAERAAQRQLIRP
ncbi:MAG: ROK family protein [Propionicimonas sp.]|nr:ROK family protein [Propionicimonas sp.]